MLFQKKAADGGDTWLIVGLGNPEKKYDGTRHNVGFETLDHLAECWNIQPVKAKFQGLWGQGTVDGRKVVLLKPLTYMNLSGQSVGAAAQFFKIPPQRVIVLCDDVDQAAGHMRIRPQGSAGGHNGLKDIIAHLGSQEFIRVRMGVGRKPRPDYDLADWVLSTVSKTEWPDYQDAMEHAAEAALCIVKNGCEKAAAEYNGKRF